jgi:hypothetical protein
MIAAVGLLGLVGSALVGSAPASEPAANDAALPQVYRYRAPNVDTLRQRFADPPREAGPWVYWMWFDNVVAKEEITREIEEMAAAGIAGAELRCITLHGFPGRAGEEFAQRATAHVIKRPLTDTFNSAIGPDDYAIQIQQEHPGRRVCESLHEAERSPPAADTVDQVTGEAEDADTGQSQPGELRLVEENPGGSSGGKQRAAQQKAGKIAVVQHRLLLSVMRVYPWHNQAETHP